MKRETHPRCKQLDRAAFIAWLKSMPSDFFAGTGGERLPKGRRFADSSPLTIFLFDTTRDLGWLIGVTRAEYQFHDGGTQLFAMPTWAREFQKKAFDTRGELTCAWCLAALGEVA
jgi:hypothetical protein